MNAFYYIVTVDMFRYYYGHLQGGYNKCTIAINVSESVHSLKILCV